MSATPAAPTPHSVPRPASPSRGEADSAQTHLQGGPSSVGWGSPGHQRSARSWQAGSRASRADVPQLLEQVGSPRRRCMTQACRWNLPRVEFRGAPARLGRRVWCEAHFVPLPSKCLWGAAPYHGHFGSRMKHLMAAGMGDCRPAPWHPETRSLGSPSPKGPKS